MPPIPDPRFDISFCPLDEAVRGQLRIDQRKAWAAKRKRDNYKTPPCFNNGQKYPLPQWLGLREPSYGYDTPKSPFPPKRRPAREQQAVNAQLPKPDILEMQEELKDLLGGTQCANGGQAQNRDRGGLYTDSEDGELVAEQAALFANSSVGS